MPCPLPGDLPDLGIEPRTVSVFLCVLGVGVILIYVSLLCVTISFMITEDFVYIFHVYVSVGLESCTGVEYLVI